MMATRLRQMLEGPLLLTDDTGLTRDERPKRPPKEHLAPREPMSLARAPGGPGTQRPLPSLPKVDRGR
jgi:hypothetical protein